jgi:anti-anti-sigma factor
MAENQQAILDVYEAGPTTVVGFGERDILDNINLSVCREQLLELLKANASHTLGFDLTGVKIVPSGFLGLMASVRSLGVDVHLYNPSPDVREVLATTNLDKIMPIHELELPARKSSQE